MRQVVALPSFERSVKKLRSSDKAHLAEGLEQFNTLVFTRDAPPGLGFKKINHDKYEFRAGLKLRVVVKAEGDRYYLILAGSHDDVKRYLRKYR